MTKERLGYVTIGALGGIFAVMIVALIFGYNPSDDFLKTNHIVESLGIFLVAGILWHFFPKKWRSNILTIVPFSIGAGLVWQWVSYIVFIDVGSILQVTYSWFSHGITTILFVGTPILLVSRFIRKEKKMFGIDTVNGKGLLVNFLLCFSVSFVILLLIFHFEIYTFFESLFSFMV